MKYCIILLLSLLVLTNCTYFVDCPDKSENDKLTIGELKMNTFIHILPEKDFCQILNRNENIELCHQILNECSGLINDLQNINESEFIRASHVEQCYNSLTSQIDMEFIFNGLVKPCQLDKLSQSYLIKSDLDEDEDEDQDQNDGEYYYQNIKLNDFNTVQFTMENDIIQFKLKDYTQSNEDNVLGFVYQQFDEEVVLKFQQSGDGINWENLEKEEEAQSKGLTQVYDLDDMIYAGKKNAYVYIQVTCESGCFDGFKQVIGQFQISEWSVDFNHEDGTVQYLQSYELKDESNVLLNVFDGEENIVYIKSFINTDIQKTKFIHAMYQNKEMEKYLNNLVTISVKNTQDKEPRQFKDWPSPFVAYPIQMADGEDENQQFQQYSFFNNHVIDFDGEGSNWFAITIYVQPVEAHEVTSFSSLYVGICNAQQTDNHQFNTNLLKNQFSTTLEFDVEFDIEKPFSLEHQILGMTEFDQGFSMITFIPDYVKKVPQEISPVFSGIEVLDYTTVFAGQGTYFVTWIFQVKQGDDFSVKIENKIQSDHIVEINDEQLINTININEERFSYLLFQKYDKDVSTTYSQYTLYFALDEEIDVDKIEINQYIGYNYLNVPVPLQLYADEQLVDLVQDEFGQIYLQIDLTDNERCESDEGCILYTNILYRDGEIDFENAQIFLKTEIVDDKKHNLVNGNFRSFTLSEHFPKEIIQTTYSYQDDKTGLLINAQNLEDVDLKITGYLKADEKASVEISGNNSFTRKIVHFTPEQIKNSCPEQCTVTIIAERASDEDTFDNQVSGTVQLLNFQQNEDAEQQQQIFNFEEIYFEDNRIYGDYQITKSFALLKSQEESNLVANQFFFKISEKSKEQKLITAFLAHAENNLNISIFQKFEYEQMSQKQIQEQSLKSQGVYLLPQCDEDGEEFDEDILCLFEIVVIVRQTGELEKAENALYFTTGNVNQLTQIQDQQQVDEILGIEKALSQVIILNDQNEMLPRIKIVQSLPTDNDDDEDYDGEDEYIQIQSDILESEGKYSLFYIDHSAENQYEKINYIYNDLIQDNTQTIFIENTVKKQYFLFFSQSNPVLERYSVSFQEFEADQLKQNLDQEFKVNDSKESSYKFYYQVESANSKNLEIQYTITDDDNTGKLFYDYKLYQKGSENIHYPFETKQQFNVEDKSIFVNLENQECGSECLILFNFFYTSETDESNFDIKFKLIENDTDIPNPDGEIVYNFDVGYHVQANIYNKNDILQYVTEINTQERDAEELVVAWQQVDQSVTLEITYKFNDNEFNAVDHYSQETTSSQIIITKQISDLKKSECADECKLTVQMKITEGYDGENTQILGYLQAMFEFKEDQKISRNGPVILNEVEPVFQSYVQYKNTNNAIYAKVFASSTPEEPRMFFAMYQADSDENYDNLVVTIAVNNEKNEEPGLWADWPEPRIPAISEDGEDQEVQQERFYNSYLLDEECSNGCWFAITIYIQNDQSSAKPAKLDSQIYMGVILLQETEKTYFKSHYKKNQFALALKYTITSETASFSHQILDLSEFDKGYSEIQFLSAAKEQIPANLELVLAASEAYNYRTVQTAPGTFFVLWLFQKTTSNIDVVIKGSKNDQQIKNLQPFSQEVYMPVNAYEYNYLQYQKHTKADSSDHTKYKLYFSFDKELSQEKLVINKYIDYLDVNRPVPLELYQTEDVQLLQDQDMGKPYIEIDLSENEQCETDTGCVLYVNLQYNDGELESELPRIVTRTELYYADQVQLVHGNQRPVRLTQYFPREVVTQDYVASSENHQITVNFQNLEHHPIQISGKLFIDGEESENFESKNFEGGNTSAQVIAKLSSGADKCSSESSKCVLQFIAQKVNDEDIFDEQVSGAFQLLSFNKKDNIYEFEQIEYPGEKLFKYFGNVIDTSYPALQVGEYVKQNYKVSCQDGEQLVVTAFQALSDNAQFLVAQNSDIEKEKSITDLQLPNQTNGQYLLPKCKQSGKACTYEIAVILKQTAKPEETQNSIYFETNTLSSFNSIQEGQNLPKNTDPSKNIVSFHYELNNSAAKSLGIKLQLNEYEYNEFISSNNQKEKNKETQLRILQDGEDGEHDPVDPNEEAVPITENQGRYIVYFFDNSNYIEQKDKIVYLQNFNTNNEFQIANPLQKYYITYLANPKQTKVTTQIQYNQEEQYSNFGTLLEAGKETQISFNSKHNYFDMYYQVPQPYIYNLQLTIPAKFVANFQYAIQTYPSNAKNQYFPVDGEYISAETEKIIIDNFALGCGYKCNILIRVYYETKEQKEFKLTLDNIHNDIVGKKSSHLGLIIGLSLGGLVVILAAVFFFIRYQKQKRQNHLDYQDMEYGKKNSYDEDEEDVGPSIQYKQYNDE